MHPQKLLTGLCMALTCTALPRIIKHAVRDIKSISGLLSPPSTLSEPRAAPNNTVVIFPLLGEALATGKLPNITFNDSLVYGASVDWDLSTTLSFCKDTSAPSINPGIVSRLFKGPYTSASSYDLLRNHHGMIWASTNSYKPYTMGTQIFICNFGQYDVAYNGAEYNIVNDMLNAKCGDKGGWVYFNDWKLWVGRDVTNDYGTYRAACGQNPI